MKLDWLQIIHEVLPHKAKTIMDHLIATSQDAVIKLEGEPASTIDFVNLLKWVLVFFSTNMKYLLWCKVLFQNLYVELYTCKGNHLAHMYKG